MITIGCHYCYSIRKYAVVEGNWSRYGIRTISKKFFEPKRVKKSFLPHIPEGVRVRRDELLPEEIKGSWTDQQTLGRLKKERERTGLRLLASDMYDDNVSICSGTPWIPGTDIYISRCSLVRGLVGETLTNSNFPNPMTGINFTHTHPSNPGGPLFHLSGPPTFIGLKLLCGSTSNKLPHLPDFHPSVSLYQ